MADYILAIDQGTTSSRAIIFDKAARSSRPASSSTSRSSPGPAGSSTTRSRSGDNTREVIGQALGKADLTRHDIAAVGITNQRETAVVWDKNTGEPVYNAIVWQDTRTQPIVDRLAADGGVERFKQDVGPAARHLLLRHEDRLDPRERRGRAREGRGRRPALRHHRHLGALEPHRRRRRRRARHRRHERQPHDVHGPRDARSGTTTSSPRSACRGRCCPRSAPPPRSTARVESSSLLREVPVAGILGDQQAATFGQAAFDAGRVEEHLRHRQLPHLQHRRGDRPLQERPAHDARLQARRRASRTTRSRARSPSPVRSSSGCATTSA